MPECCKDCDWLQRFWGSLCCQNLHGSFGIAVPGTHYCGQFTPRTGEIQHANPPGWQDMTEF